MEPIRHRQLPNGLEVTIYDETNRYFGDYHRICLRVVLRYDLAAAANRDDPFWREALTKLGPELRVEKTLERMAVAGSDVDRTVTALADDFLATAGSYLGRPDALRKLVQKEMEKSSKTTRIY